MSIHDYVDEAYSMGDNEICQLLAIYPREDLVIYTDEGALEENEIYTIITRKEAVSLIKSCFYGYWDFKKLELENFSLEDLNTLNILQSIYWNKLEARINQHLVSFHAKKLINFVEYTIFRDLYPLRNMTDYDYLVQKFANEFALISERHFQNSKDIITWFFAMRPNILNSNNNEKRLMFNTEAYETSLEFALYAEDYIDKDKLKLFIDKLKTWNLLNAPHGIIRLLNTANPN